MPLWQSTAGRPFSELHTPPPFPPAAHVADTTIGLGDLVPNHIWGYLWSLEVLVGLSLFAAAIQAETEAVEEAEEKLEREAERLTGLDLDGDGVVGEAAGRVTERVGKELL